MCEFVRFKASAKGIGKCDGYFYLYKPKKRRSDPYEELFKSDTVMKHYDPVWKEVKIPFERFVDGDKYLVLKFVVYDWDKISNDDYVGEFRFTLEKLLSKQKCQFKLTQPGTKKSRGVVTIEGCQKYTETPENYEKFLKAEEDKNRKTASIFGIKLGGGKKKKKASSSEAGGMKVPKGSFTKKIHFSNGFYEGEVVAKMTGSNQYTMLMHGYGNYFFDDGGMYEGQFLNNVKEGFGKYLYANDSQYEGHWKGGKFHGIGRYTYSSGTVFEGSFVNNIKEGTAKEYFKSGKVKFIGDYKNNKRCGQGSLVYENGSVYQGEFANNKKHGLGVMVYGDETQCPGDEWIGWWENDQKKLEYLQKMMQDLRLSKFFGVMKEKGFRMSMLREMGNEDVDTFLEMVFKEKAHAQRVKKHLVENTREIMDLISAVPHEEDLAEQLDQGALTDRGYGKKKKKKK